SPLPSPPPSTRFPYTTLFRSLGKSRHAVLRGVVAVVALVVVRRGVALIVGRHDAGAKHHVFLAVAAIHLLHRVGLDEVLRRVGRSEEHTSELQSRFDLVCRLL